MAKSLFTRRSTFPPRCFALLLFLLAVVFSWGSTFFGSTLRIETTGEPRKMLSARIMLEIILFFLCSDLCVMKAYSNNLRRSFLYLIVDSIKIKNF